MNSFWWKYVLSGIISLGGSWQRATAQTLTTPNDSAAWEAARASYRAALGIESMLYNGPEYVAYTTLGTVGHPFFQEPETHLGTLTYQGGTFANVPLLYDLARDLVALRLPGQSTSLTLVSEKVSSFLLDGHHFVRITGDSLLPTGFYEVLVEGPLRLLARHHKQSQRATVSQNLVQQYRQSDELLLRTPTSMGELSNVKQLVALLPSHRDDVLRYARQQRLSFSVADRSASAEQLLHYYYTLRP